MKKNGKRKQDRILPTLCGGDIELGNFILGRKSAGGTSFEASRAALSEIDGLPGEERSRTMICDCEMCRRSRAAGAGNGASRVVFNPQDWGRKYLPANGGCAYIDLEHLELCLPEVISAWDWVACWHAMLRIAQRAMRSANEKLPRGQKLQLLANNSDGRGNSYGSHLNFLISRRAWDNIFHRRIHHMLYLASFQASSIVYTGQGKVGSENGAADASFQLSQRADFFERLVGSQTTRNRPIINSRDESLCGEDEDMARLHVIFFDNTLCHTATLLKVGVMQIILSMIEAGRVNVNLILDDPVESLTRWSHDPRLETRAPLTSGKKLTAVELQMLFLEEAKEFVESGGCIESVPRAEEIIALWEDTLMKLAARDFDSLASRLDWVLKLSLLEQVIAERADLSWDSPEIKHLDHLYSSLDEEEGLYWAYERSGLVERAVTDDCIEHFTTSPPEDTRAWTRAMLLRAVERDAIADVDWDEIKFRVEAQRFRAKYRKLDMSNPLAMTRAAAEGAFETSETLDELLDALEAQEEIQAVQ
ncbi:MAG: proteasome accessory factor PafA2 family protein [Acidobacteriota bacterium]